MVSRIFTCHVAICNATHLASDLIHVFYSVSITTVQATMKTRIARRSNWNPLMLQLKTQNNNYIKIAYNVSQRVRFGIHQTAITKKPPAQTNKLTGCFSGSGGAMVVTGGGPDLLPVHPMLFNPEIAHTINNNRDDCNSSSTCARQILQKAKQTKTEPHFRSTVGEY